MTGKARVLSSSAVITVKDPFYQTEIQIGEVDKFSAKSTSSTIKSRPIGTAIENVQYKYGGYELSFNGGKIDWNLANMFHAQDLLARTAGDSPRFNIQQTIRYADGTVETYIYINAIIHGYEIDIDSGSEVTEAFSGYAPTRDQLGLEQFQSTVYAALTTTVQQAINEAQNIIADQIGFF
jgi:hypothetical protein